MPDGEHQFLDLKASDLPQEIGLILHRVLGGREPHLAVDLGSRGVVASRYLVEVLAPLILEATELDVLVAHHVGVRRQAPLHRVDGIAHHLVPILVVQRDLLEATAILLGDIRSNLDIFFRRAVDIPVLVFHPDADVEDRRVIARLLQQVDNDRAIHPSRY